MLRPNGPDASSAHAAMKMEELDNKIAETDQRLAAQTRSLADVSAEASTAQKEEMVLRAEALLCPWLGSRNTPLPEECM